MHFKAVRMLVLATAFWALSFPTMRALSLIQQPLVPGADSWFFSSLCVCYRFALAALVLLLICGRRMKGLTRSEISQGAGMALFGAGGILFQMDGLARTPASVSAFLTQGYCLWIPLWVALRYWKLPHRRLLLGCVMVLGGAAILARVDWDQLRLGWGEGETLIASVLFGGQILWLERPVYKGNDVTRFSVVMFVVMSLACLPLVWWHAPSAAALVDAYRAPATWLCLAMLVVPSTLGGYMLMNRWQPYVTATEAGLIYCGEPIFASLLATFMPGLYFIVFGVPYDNETITASLLLGGALITAANVMIQWPPAKQPEEAGL